MVQAAPAPVEKKKDEKEDKRGKNRPTLKERMAKEYDFDVEDSENLFHQLLANGKIQLPSCKRPAEEGKTNDPKYCLFHRIISHNIKDCFVFKEKVQELLDKNVISLAKEEKKVTTNMVSMQFGDFPVIVPVQHEEQDDVEFRLIKDSDDSDDGLVPVELPDGSAMWVHPDLMEDEDWEIVKPRSHSRVVQTPLVPAYKLRGAEKPKNKKSKKKNEVQPVDLLEQQPRVPCTLAEFIPPELFKEPSEASSLSEISDIFTCNKIHWHNQANGDARTGSICRVGGCNGSIVIGRVFG